MLTTTAITALKNCIKDNVAFAKYKVGSSYYQTEIRSAYITADGRVVITFLIDHTIPVISPCPKSSSTTVMEHFGQPKPRASRAKTCKKVFCIALLLLSPRAKKEVRWMYPKVDWKDHVVQRPKTYTETVNPDGSKTFTDAPGEVVQQGTPMSATNFNNLEVGISDAHTFIATFLQFWLNFRRWVEGKVTAIESLIAGNTASIGANTSAISTLQTGAATSAANIGKLEADDTPESKSITLTNTAKWPFNSSLQTVALTTNRPTTNYTVDAEIKAVAGGTLQGVRITDRLANGFKVAFEGDATSATLKLIIKGGINR